MGGIVGAVGSAVGTFVGNTDMGLGEIVGVTEHGSRQKFSMQLAAGLQQSEFA